jgi:hypothetical protein
MKTSMTVYLRATVRGVRLIRLAVSIDRAFGQPLQHFALAGSPFSPSSL